MHRGNAMNRRDRQLAPVVTLEERLIAALLTPLVFNASVIIVVAMASRRVHYVFFNLTRVYHALGSGAILLLVAPAIVGFVAGFDGTVKIFGHAFRTHHDHERSWPATALVWGVFAGAVIFMNTRVAG